MTRTRRTTSTRRGFTLIEVLAALVLIGVVLPAAMRGVSIALVTASRSRHVGEATELARSKLTELSLASDASGYTGGGDFGTDWPEYTWTATATARQYGESEIVVTVKWKARGQEESIALSTLAYPNALMTGTSSSGTSTGTSAGGGATP